MNSESLSVDLVFDLSEANDFSFASYHLVALPVHFYIIHTTNIVNQFFPPALLICIFMYSVTKIDLSHDLLQKIVSSVF